ncbi:MAG: GHKL domain-containing protein [Bacillaceae bacterium]|nr:GHKL domain-containing protein [Bacillaceae bacterium]
MDIENFQAAHKYLKQMIGDIRITNKALAIKNPVLASMLYSKMDKYQKDQIRFDSQIKSEEIVHLLSSTDLIRLISNLLDNAHEATLELPNEERSIELLMVESDNSLKLK